MVAKYGSRRQLQTLIRCNAVETAVVAVNNEPGSPTVAQYAVEILQNLQVCQETCYGDENLRPARDGLLRNDIG